MTISTALSLEDAVIFVFNHGERQFRIPIVHQSTKFQKKNWTMWGSFFSQFSWGDFVAHLVH